MTLYETAHQYRQRHAASQVATDTNRGFQGRASLRREAFGVHVRGATNESLMVKDLKLAANFRDDANAGSLLVEVDDDETHGSFLLWEPTITHDEALVCRVSKDHGVMAFFPPKNSA
ncbi:MAG: hypothetical protein O3C40_28500 [Planctomycetota bacterium]|nr:hypothetical protein [Planctomycetota bacterium]